MAPKCRIASHLFLLAFDCSEPLARPAHWGFGKGPPSILAIFPITFWHPAVYLCARLLVIDAVACRVKPVHSRSMYWPKFPEIASNTPATRLIADKSAIQQTGRRRVELDVMNHNRPTNNRAAENRDDRMAEFLELYSTNYPHFSFM